VRARSAIPIPAALTNIPHSFAWTRPSCAAMNQANDIELIRHGRELAADCVQRKEEFAIKHDARMQPKYPGPTMLFQRMVTTPLALCLSLRVHSRYPPHLGPRVYFSVRWFLIRLSNKEFSYGILCNFVRP
jgi:hypothetical protein